MKKVIKTKKLKEAVYVLSGERFCDSTERAIFTALNAGRIKIEDMYYALWVEGFRWNGDCWYRRALRMPRIIKLYREVQNTTNRLYKLGEP